MMLTDEFLEKLKEDMETASNPYWTRREARRVADIDPSTMIALIEEVQALRVSVTKSLGLLGELQEVRGERDALKAASKKWGLLMNQLSEEREAFRVEAENLQSLVCYLEHRLENCGCINE